MEAFIASHANAIGAVAAILTVVALILAIYQTVDLKDINLALSTRDIGSFPGYVGELTKLIRSAKERIIIVCDAPGYCIFSSRDLWTDYKAALEWAKEENIRNSVPSLAVLWMDEECRKDVLREQFKPNLTTTIPKEQTSWKVGIEDKLNHFLRAEGKQQEAETLSYSKFEEIVEQAHQRMISEMQAVGFTPLHRSLSLYFWIVDDRAIFAIPNYGDRGKGRGFWTRDKNIVDGLVSIHMRLKEDKECASGHS